MERKQETSKDLKKGGERTKEEEENEEEEEEEEEETPIGQRSLADMPRRKKAEQQPEVQSVSRSDKLPRSEADGWLFKRAKDSYAFTDKMARSRISPDAEAYDMNHKRRGVALIFNHINFKTMAPRKGTVKDCADLKAALARLGFEIRVYTDPTMDTTLSTLRSTAAEDHTDADCLLVAVMSHGESGLVHSTDSLYPVDMLWTPFTGDRCYTLAGKPKLFFIQACRGAQLDKGVRIVAQSATDSRSTYSIPAYADIMVAYSTYDGFYSWRNPDAGSWFIQAICHELNLHGRTRDLLTMMTFVNRRVAIEYQSYVPHNQSFDAKKQIPSVVSMLTRLVYFVEKQPGLMDDSSDQRTEDEKGIRRIA